MSSIYFYKIPYEGEKKSILNLIKDRDWNIKIKFPEEGIVLMKFPEDIDEEVTFNENLVFDDLTQTKFCSFRGITESEFEEAQDMEILEEKKNENEIKKDESKNIEQKRNS